jgi:hypothetical protein
MTTVDMQFDNGLTASQADTLLGAAIATWCLENRELLE